MAIKSAVTTTANSSNRNINYANSILTDITRNTTWTRQSDWLTLPAVINTEQKFVGLFAVWDNSPNFCTVRCSTSAGTWTVNWGDGTTETVTSGTLRTHQYSYANGALTGTESTRGYKQAIVTVTPTTANITSFQIHERYTAATGASGAGTPNTRYAVNWLDISLSLPYATTLTFTDTSSTNCPYLEQIKIYKLANSMTSFGYLFRGCEGLQSVPVLYHPTSLTAMNNMFQNCASLREIPSSVNFALIDTTNSMFESCHSLTTVTVDMPLVSDATSMFQSCRSLKEAVVTSIGSSKNSGTTTASSMFGYCNSLMKATIQGVARLNTLDHTFFNCYSLQYAYIDYNTTSLTSLTNIFNSCHALKFVPYFDTSSVTTMDGAFASCYSIPTIPAFNTSSVTNMQSMLDNCHALIKVPVLDTYNVTNFYGVFSTCRALKEAPNWDFTNGTSVQSLFTTCYSLTKLPAGLSFPNAYDATNMFNSCIGLQRIDVNMGNWWRTGTNFASSCSALETFNLTISGGQARVFSGVSCTSAVGAFSCDNIFVMVPCQTVTISGTLTGTATISGYTTPKTYYIKTTNESTTFTLSETHNGTPITTTAGTVDGLTFTLGGSALQTMNYFLAYNYGLLDCPTFPAALTNLNAVTNTEAMFYEVQQLQTIPDNFLNTANVTSFGSMFRHCYKLKDGPALTTTKATSFNYMYESCQKMRTIGALSNSSLVTNFNNFASSCYTLKKTPTLNLTGSTDNGAMFGSCYSLNDASGLSNIKFNTSFDNCQLSGTALNVIYTNLPVVTTKTINVTVNWGTTSSGSGINAVHTPSIATAKGWTVTA